MQVGNEGAKWLAEGLRSNNSLDGISLRSNAIGDMGAELLADALKVRLGCEAEGPKGNKR